MKRYVKYHDQSLKDPELEKKINIKSEVNDRIIPKITFNLTMFQSDD